jgi:nucleoside-diphosphate-sugar epimerase|tara:strand:+ start:552 stop:1457 length:906 start_codon:yes stop_codon:yes gene_type:complete
MEVVITDMDYEVDYFEGKTRKILVLGSGGQVGAYLTEYLRCADVEVMEFDITNGPDQDMTVIPNGELEAKIYMADFVYFLAFDVGGSHYLKKYQHTFNFIDNNTRLMANAFGLIEKYKKPFVFASSQMSNMSYSPYGVLKRVGELYTKSLGGLIVKFWNVYGIEKDMDKAHVITDFIRKGFETGVIDMMTDGTEAREFLYAEDCCEALETVMDEYDNLSCDDELHITTGVYTTVLEIAEEIKSLFFSIGKKITVIPDEKKDSVQRDARNVPDPYIKEFWQPTTSVKEGLKKVFEEMKKDYE